MAKTYRLSAGAKITNAVFRTLTRLGLGARYRHILTVRGRKSGRPYSTPVDVMKVDGERWLVAPYGVVSWVRNARAAGEVTLSRGRRSETVGVVEVYGMEAARVLRTYAREVAVTRSYFDAKPDASDEAFEAEVERHPVFRVVPRAAA